MSLRKVHRTIVTRSAERAFTVVLVESSSSGREAEAGEAPSIGSWFLAGSEVTRQTMRLPNGNYQCTQCRLVLDVDAQAEPKVAIHAASGQPNEVIITVDGIEIHRCIGEDGQAADNSM